MLSSGDPRIAEHEALHGSMGRLSTPANTNEGEEKDLMGGRSLLLAMVVQGSFTHEDRLLAISPALRPIVIA